MPVEPGKIAADADSLNPADAVLTQPINTDISDHFIKGVEGMVNEKDPQLALDISITLKDPELSEEDRLALLAAQRRVANNQQ